MAAENVKIFGLALHTRVMLFMENSLQKSINRSIMRCIVLAAYTLLTLIFTYPVAFSSKLPGVGDAYWFLWDLWWFKKALLSFVDPYYTPYLFHPIGASLAFSEITPLNAIISIPLQLAFGLIDSYNILWILTFILSGFGVFLLVEYLTGDSKAAFIAGLIFMFSPYRFAHAYAGHLNLLSTEWIPFCVLYFIKTIRENNKLDAVYATLFLVLNALSCYYYIIYIFIFTILYLTYSQYIYKNIFNLNILKRILLIQISFCLVVLPFMYPMLRDLLSSNSHYMYAGNFEIFSADLIGFLIPTEFHPILNNYFSSFYKNTYLTDGKAEYIVYAGIIPIVLSTISILKSRQAHFWGLSAGIFFILSLGPILHINGAKCIQLPYMVLMKIPIFSLAHIPSRWDIMLMLSLAVLSGYGIGYIFKHFNFKSIYKIIIFIMLVTFVLFDFLSVPFPVSTTTVPDFYNQIAMEKEDYAIIDVPFWPPYYYPQYMFYQTVHEKKLVNGYVSRTPDDVIQFLNSAPVIKYLTYLSQPSAYGNIENRTILGNEQSILINYNIKYIILHKDLMTTDQFGSIEILLKQTLIDTQVIYENDFLKVYRINKLN